MHLVQYALNITALKEYLNTVGQVRTVLDFFDGFVKMVRSDTYDKNILCLVKKFYLELFATKKIKGRI